VNWRWACPQFLRQTFHERALHSIAYLGLRILRAAAGQRGTGTTSRSRALAFKWIRILFRCSKGRKPYDEAIYYRALDARRPKTELVPAKKLHWKNVAGFLKIAIKKA
jgi:hypothetical protein